MCNLCLRIKCPPSCPNHERITYGSCDNCGNPIYVNEDDAVRDADGHTFCSRSCFEDYYGFEYIDWSDVD